MIRIYKKYFAELLAKYVNLPFETISAMIEIPPENISGDLAFPCFPLAKQAKLSPIMLAKELTEKLSSPDFDRFEAVGGYVNAHIKKMDFIKEYFTADAGKFHPFAMMTPEKVMVEYLSANPNKPLHIGQARNICVGDSMRRIYEYL